LAPLAGEKTVNHKENQLMQGDEPHPSARSNPGKGGDKGARVAAVVVTYFPDDAVLARLASVASQFASLVVVDNGSPMETCSLLSQWVEARGGVWISNGRNLGLGVALNRGVEQAHTLGFEWAVTFDQDSWPDPGFSAALWETHLDRPRAAVIGPRIQEEASEVARYRWVRRHPRWPGCFERVPCRGEDLGNVTMLVTSGSMIELTTWQTLGGFDEGLFIDYIDTDYCLRVIRAGREVTVAAGALLHHRLGARQSASLLGRDFRPMHHAAFRHYYIARNRLAMWRRHALAVPHWAAFDLSYGLYNLFRVLVFEEQRWRKLRAMLRGTWDGMLGRRGPMR
jgi:rhamnosyltransferase